eukprot:TRINITY_DN5239_c0_g1_i1.p1 TRINITY_DN5239_c0_g1~~TRINITY_DN5239_c0_g1_i1.p1  ORF type:complete len:903 (+),score=232.85 TRINITY_DN5239_c0_g1_i1:129-2837(+)
MLHAHTYSDGVPEPPPDWGAAARWSTAASRASSARNRTTLPCDPTFSDGDWALTYIIGGLFYLLTLLSFPAVRRWRRTLDLGDDAPVWSPLRVQQCGLTQIAACAGLGWFAHAVVLEQVPCSSADRVLPPSGAVCWLRAFWRTAAACLLASSVTVKQYKFYNRYVSRERRLPTWVYMLLGVTPYLVLVSLPVWKEWYTAPSCNDDHMEQRAMFAWTAVLLAASLYLTIALRDCVCNFPNRVSGRVEVACFTCIVAAWAFHLWVRQAGNVARGAVLAGSLALAPNIMYWAALGQLLWRCAEGDREFCLKYQQLYAPATLVTDGAIDPADTPPARSRGGEDGAARQLPSPVCSPRVGAAAAADYFEADRLAALIDAGDKLAVWEFLQGATLGLLQSGDRSGHTPLHRAVLGGHVELTEFLLQMGCPPDAPGGADAERALHIAARRGDCPTIAALCAPGRGTDVDAVTARGVTPLAAAVASGAADAVALLLQHGARLDVPAPAAGRGGSWEDAHVCDAGTLRSWAKQPFTVAVEAGNVALLRLMLVHAAAQGGERDLLRRVSRFGLSPLMVAAALGHEAVAAELLGAGADAWQRNPRDRRSVLHYNAMQGSESLFTLLRGWFAAAEAPRSPSSRRLAARPQPAAELPPLTGSPPRAGGGDAGHTYESRQSDPTGGAVSAAAQLQVGRRVQETPAAALLRSASSYPLQPTPMQGPVAPPTSLDRDGQLLSGSNWRDPSTYATYTDIQSAGRLGSNLSLGGELALSPTPSNGSQQLFGALLSAPDNLGRTPLHYAVIRGHAELAAVLLAEGADPRARDAQRPENGCLGQTPVEYARQLLHDRSRSPSHGQYARVLQVFQQRDEAVARWRAAGARAGGGDSLQSVDSASVAAAVPSSRPEPLSVTLSA